MHSAFLITDSRYFLQAQEEIDSNWLLIKAGNPGEPQDWIEWIVVSLSFFLKEKTILIYVPRRTQTKSQAGSSRIGIDARMISHEKATLLNSKLGAIQSKLVYPPQNLVDLIWKAKPVKPDAAIYIQSTEFAGVCLLSFCFCFCFFFKNEKHHFR